MIERLASEVPLLRRRAGEIAISQVEVAEYRTRVFSLVGSLLRRQGWSLVLYGGESGFDLELSAENLSALPLDYARVRNRFILGGRLVLQRGVLVGLVESQIAVVTLNPRNLSNWLVLVARKLLRRPSVVWGHAWPRSGSRGLASRPRRWMRKLATAQLTYTVDELEDLRVHDKRVRARAAPNALYDRDEISAPEYGPDVIYVGRLVPEKKVDTLMRAFAGALKAEEGIGRLRIVGSGPERESLEQLSVSLGVRDRVTFLGKVTEPDTVRAAYKGTFCAVSPGYVGLCATQSVGFGRPLIYAENEPHAPEVVIVRSGYGVPFDAKSPESLADRIVSVFRSADRWANLSASMAGFVRSNYSNEVMAGAFFDALLEFADN